MMATRQQARISILVAILSLLWTGIFSPERASARADTSGAAAPASELTDAKRDGILAKQSDVPIRFMKNVGQWDSRILYQGTRGPVAVRFLRDGLSFATSRPVVEPGEPDPTAIERPASEALVWNLAFQGGNPEVQLQVDGEQDSRTHFLRGKTPADWHVNVPDYESLTYREIYPGIDIKYYSGDLGPEYDVIVQPGADLDRVVLRHDGIESLAIDDDGSLTIKTPWGDVSDTAPFSYQVHDGERREVDVRYALRDDRTLGFEIFGDHDPERELVIDPFILNMSTFLGATSLTNNNQALDVVMDTSGNVYVTGACDSSYPTTSGVVQELPGGGIDVFVTKLSADGSTREFSTYVGGSGDEEGNRIELDGGVVVSGFTDSPWSELPSTAEFGPEGGLTAFALKLNATGSAFDFFTLIGGSNNERAFGLAIDDLGAVYVGGDTSSDDFPATPGAFQTARAGGLDAFVAKLNASGSLVQATYLGGTSLDLAFDVAVNGSGEAHATGFTFSPNFPTTPGVPQPFPSPGFNAFVTRLDDDAAALGFSTYYGGSAFEMGRGIEVDGNGGVVVIGRTNSLDLPSNPQMRLVPQAAPGGGVDAFVAKWVNDGTKLEWSTYLGGSSSDVGEGLDLFGSEMFLTGATRSADFPVFFSSPPLAGGQDVFLGNLRQTYSFLHTTCDMRFFGGSADELVDPRIDHEFAFGVKKVAVSATTRSADFPTTPGVIEPIKPNGAFDQPAAFVMEECQTCLCVFFDSISATCTSPAPYILVEWSAFETFDTLAYTVLRAEAPVVSPADYQPVHFEGAGAGSYAWVDTTAHSGIRYFYAIVEHNTNGIGTASPPFTTADVCAITCGGIANLPCPPCHRCEIPPPPPNDPFGICVYDPLFCGFEH